MRPERARYDIVLFRFPRFIGRTAAFRTYILPLRSPASRPINRQIEVNRQIEDPLWSRAGNLELCHSAATYNMLIVPIVGFLKNK